jgi:hypothetical protein
MVHFVHQHIAFHACPKKSSCPLILLRLVPVKSFDKARVVRYILAAVFAEKGA